jgi:hypothetical protein
MTVAEQKAKLDAIAAEVVQTYHQVQRAEVELLTDSTGDAAAKFLVTLADPPGDTLIPYIDIEPIEATVRRLTAGLGLVVYVRFRLASEVREIEAGTYYG